MILRRGGQLIAAWAWLTFAAAITVAAEPGAVATAAPDTAAAFTVRPRLDDLFFYPCADCHEFMDPNDQVRELEVAEGHPALLDHGNGAMWCYSCHAGPDFVTLQDLMGRPIPFDEGYRTCGGCHGVRFQGWRHGAHGKRLANWQGERTLYSCVECHNPHAPAIAPRAPEPPPPVRAGLHRAHGESHEPARRPWSEEGATGER